MKPKDGIVLVKEMKKMCLLTCALLSVSAVFAQTEDTGLTGVHGYTPEGYVPVTEPAVLENIERFKDMKLGLMMHFGLYNQVGLIESWPLNDQAQQWARPVCDMGVGDDFKRNYWNLNRSFNPIRYDPGEWARAARRNGFKYLCFTTKHHDGFCMWDTRYTDYKVTAEDCPYARTKHPDILKATYDAFRKEGLAISLYFSKGDWHHPDYWDNLGLGYRTTWLPSYDPSKQPERWRRYKEFTWNQVLELVKNYGRFEVLWLDCAAVGCKKETSIDIDGLVTECRKVQPWLIAADRTIGGKSENLLTPEQCVPERPLLCPWESCVTMAANWSYHYDDMYKPTKDLLDLLIGVVAKGGCLVLNVSPRPDGVIPTPALKRMDEVGAWLAKNGEAIYGTRPVAPYMIESWAFTQKKGRLFAIRKTRPGETEVHQVVLPRETTEHRIDRVIHLASGRTLPTEQTEDGWIVRFPSDVTADPNADAFEVIQGRRDFLVEGKDGCAIQTAIDAAAAAGGGRVVVRAGNYQSCSLRLKSHVELHLEKGATIVGGTKSDDYFDFPTNVCAVRPEDSSKVFLYGWDLEDIAITGEGVIEGQGPEFFNRTELPFEGAFWAKPPHPRPRMVQLVRCRDVRFEGVTFKDSPGWTMLIRLCSNVTVENIKVIADQRIINSDGIDFDGCRHVRVRRSTFKTGDDCLIVRSMRENGSNERIVSEDIVFEDCDLDSACQTIRMGCPSDDVIRQVRIRNIRGKGQNGINFDYPARYLRPDDEGYMDLSDVLIENYTGDFYGNALKIVVEPGVKLRNVSDVTVRNFTVTSKRPLRFVGNADSPLKDIVLENVAVTTPETVVPWEAVATEPLVFRNCAFNGKNINDQKLVTPRGDRQPLIRSTSSWEAKH